MTSRFTRAISLLVVGWCVAGCGGSLRPLPGHEPAPTPSAAPAAPSPPPNEPSDSGTAAVQPKPAPTDAKPTLPAGAPFSGTYAVTEIADLSTNRTDVASGPGACTVSDCVLARRTVVFEGAALRLRFELASIFERNGDASTAAVCDAQARIDVKWEGNVMVVPTRLVAESNATFVRRKQRRTGAGTFDVDWNKDHLGCSVTLREGRYLVQFVSKELTGGRPARIELASADQTYRLRAVDPDVDLQGAINAFFGQH